MEINVEDEWRWMDEIPKQVEDDYSDWDVTLQDGLEEGWDESNLDT